MKKRELPIGSSVGGAGVLNRQFSYRDTINWPRGGEARSIVKEH
jgi:hypothetical protein